MEEGRDPGWGNLAALIPEIQSLENLLRNWIPQLPLFSTEGGDEITFYFAGIESNIPGDSS
jgi:hypothetical protein